MSILKFLLILLGTISLGIGIIGIIVPGLPTTPFLLLTAGLYVRSSDKLYQKLISNQYVGSYIMDFQTKKGLTIKVKIASISLMWIMIIISTLFFIDLLVVKISVLILGLIGTIVMGFIIPTIK